MTKLFYRNSLKAKSFTLAHTTKESNNAPGKAWHSSSDHIRSVTMLITLGWIRKWRIRQEPWHNMGVISKGLSLVVYVCKMAPRPVSHPSQNLCYLLATKLCKHKLVEDIWVSNHNPDIYVPLQQQRRDIFKRNSKRRHWQKVFSTKDKIISSGIFTSQFNKAQIP